MSLKVKIKADASQFDRTMSKTKKSVRGFGKSLMGIKSALAGVAVAMGAAFATRKLLAFISSSSEAAASIEDLALQFEVLTKSSKTAKDMIAEMKKDAAKSALSLPDYAKAGKTLLAFGTGAEKILPILKNLADVSMGNSDRFASLALAFAQTQAAGRLMGQEVLQFVNSGFNPLQQISKRTGESMIELKKRMEDGAVSSREVANAFKAATSEGGLFYKAIERGADTTKGKIAKMKNEILEIKIAFGTGFNDGLKVAADAISEGLPKLQAAATDMGKVVGKGITEAIDGDSDKLIAVGYFIGETIALGMKAGMKIGGREAAQSFWTLLEDYNPIRKLPGMAAQPKFSTAFEENKRDAGKDDIRELLEQSRTSFEQLRNMGNIGKVGGEVPGQPGWQYAGRESNTPYYEGGTGNKIIQVLERIDRSIAKPFPN